MEAYLQMIESLRTAFPNKEIISLTEASHWLGYSRGDILRDTPNFPKVRIGKREVVPIRAFAMYLAGGNK